MNPQDTYYSTMNTVTAPIRFAIDCIKAGFIILLLIGAGLLYPIIQLVNDGHVTFGGFMVSFLTALLIFTFFYTIEYTVYGGIVCLVVFYACCSSVSFVNSLTGTGFFLFVFAFLAVGILQKYIRNQIKYNRPLSPEQREKNRLFMEEYRRLHPRDDDREPVRPLPLPSDLSRPETRSEIMEAARQKRARRLARR